MNDSKNYPNIIIDNGTSYCKVGLSNDDYCKDFKNCITRPKFKQFFNFKIKDFYIGTEGINNDTKKKNL